MMAIRQRAKTKGSECRRHGRGRTAKPRRSHDSKLAALRRRRRRRPPIGPIDWKRSSHQSWYSRHILHWQGPTASTPTDPMDRRILTPSATYKSLFIHKQITGIDWMASMARDQLTSYLSIIINKYIYIYVFIYSYKHIFPLLFLFLLLLLYSSFFLYYHYYHYYHDFFCCCCYCCCCCLRVGWQCLVLVACRISWSSVATGLSTACYLDDCVCSLELQRDSIGRDQKLVLQVRALMIQLHGFPAILCILSWWFRDISTSLFPFLLPPLPFLPPFQNRTRLDSPRFSWILLDSLPTRLVSIQLQFYDTYFVWSLMLHPILLLLLLLLLPLLFRLRLDHVLSPCSRPSPLSFFIGN